MNSLPSRSDAWQRLQAADPPAWVLAHCKAVERLAHAMATRAKYVGFDVDVDAVTRGALLHDIGRSLTQGIDHAYRGADMLRQPPPLPETLCRIVETHTGAGLTAEEAAEAGLPPRDYFPRSLEEKIVAHADNLYSGPNRLSLYQVEDKYQAKGLQAAARRIVDLHEELSAKLDIDLEALGPSDLPALV